MFPRFEIFDTWITVYVFWLTLVLCFFLFTWMLKKLSRKVWINISFFFNRIIWFFLSVLVFSRLFYVISLWNEYKEIKNPLEFFIMNDYNFSLYGAIFGFFIVLIYSLKANKLKSDKYIDVSVLSFLFVATIWYIGAFFWWEVYGRETTFGIEVVYNHPYSQVPYEVAIFPLALVYAGVCFILFSILYSLFMFINIRWLVGYIGLIAFNALVVWLDYFSGKYDIIKTQLLFVNLNQIIAILLILYASIKLIQLMRNQPSKTEVISS